MVTKVWVFYRKFAIARLSCEISRKSTGKNAGRNRPRNLRLVEYRPKNAISRPNISKKFGWGVYSTLKESVVSPLLKKSTLDSDHLSNYRPVSNLSLISKIIERVVKSRLTSHLTSNNFLNPHQSAYCKHHSTETALLYIHDHLINAFGSRQVSCLCLLDLSAAFDAIDHNIRLSRLSSWFGIHGTVLDWFKSYLSSRSFRVSCAGSLSSSHTSSVVFLKVLF